MIEFKGDMPTQIHIMEQAKQGDAGAMAAMSIYNGILTVGGHVAERLGWLLDEVIRRLKGNK